MSDEGGAAAAERPRARSEVLCRELDDGFVLYEPEEGKVHSLNPVAAFIWDLCDGERTVVQIAEGLKAAPGAEGKDLLADVLETVATFRKEGLLEPAPGRGAD